MIFLALLFDPEGEVTYSCETSVDSTDYTALCPFIITAARTSNDAKSDESVCALIHKDSFSSFECLWWQITLL
jgi:hypothetical protein